MYFSMEFSYTMKSSSKHCCNRLCPYFCALSSNFFSSIFWFCILFPSTQHIKWDQRINVCCFILSIVNVCWKYRILYGYIEFYWFNWHIILCISCWPREHYSIHIHLLLLIGKSNIRIRINWKHVLQLPMVSIANKTSTIIRLFYSAITENISFEGLWNCRVFVKCFFIGKLFNLWNFKVKSFNYEYFGNFLNLFVDNSSCLVVFSDYT